MAARGNSDESREALRQLCDHYYQPVITYLQRAGHSANDEAKDLAHDFFADLLKGHRLDQLEQVILSHVNIPAMEENNSVTLDKVACCY